MAWKKISSKKYQIEIDGEFKTISVPFGKVEKIVEAFFANGGLISETGEILTDPATLIRSFGVLGDILMSDYDSKGDLVKSVGCRDLSDEEVIDLFGIASSVIENFINVISLEASKKEAQKQEMTENQAKTQE